MSVRSLPPPPRVLCRLGWGLVVVFLLGAVVRVYAVPADFVEVRRQYLEGKYEDALQKAEVALRTEPGNIDWHLLRIQTLLTLGRSEEAGTALAEALQQEPLSIRLRWLGRDVAFANGRPEDALARIDEIRQIFEGRRWMYRTPADLIVFGRMALAVGNDPKEVLDRVYLPVQKTDPKLRDVYLARGELAMEKHDFELAAKAYDEGLKQIPDDPDLLYGRAKAFSEGDREEELKSLQAALKINPRHVPSLLQMVDHEIDAEAYDDASKHLDQVVAINPGQPDAWAYRAVIAHLHNDIASEAKDRATALRLWQNNPHVDFLIGQKLSQKYRFAEGAAYQRRARTADPGYLPAQAQLASDLLRLGDETEGWSLAQKVHDRDEYDVEAYNLVTLHDTMAKYATLTSDDFVIRMSAREAPIYGSEVMALLTRAKKTLTAKYGVELARPTYVEVFADQKDFAVRTFGMPDIPGFLGVCFGRVVTANGPAATGGHPVNWRSVLWHEFCHAVTLQLTKNKMPRWLSEGISVYEEWQADPAWGMRLNPENRNLIAKNELTPVGKLSGAFLAPKSEDYLQFAYLESAMVVEFIVNKFGIEALKGVLNDLRNGTEINVALAKHTVPLEQLEKDFSAYAHERADQLAPKLNWDKPEPELMTGTGSSLELNSWELLHPDNYWILMHRVGDLMEAKKWAEARDLLQHVVDLYPVQKGPSTAWRPLVKTLHELDDEAGERTALLKWTALDDEATDAYARLMNLAAQAKQWDLVTANAERYIGVNPLVAPPWRLLAEASAATGDTAKGITAWRTLLELDPPDPAEAHYQLAVLLQKTGDLAEARRHVLMALEEAPRYRQALKLLLDLDRAKDSTALPPAHSPASATAALAP